MYIYAPSHPAPLSQHKTPQLIWYAARWTRVSRHDRRTPNLGLRVRVKYKHVYIYREGRVFLSTQQGGRMFPAMTVVYLI